MNKGKSKSLFSRINAWLHLWLGIFSGIILVFVALTGTIIVYCDEIIDWSAGKSLYAAEVKLQRVPAETLVANVNKAYPQARISEISVYKDPERTVRFRVFAKGKGLAFVYADPYTGEVLKYDRNANFFYITAHLHASFLWHGPGSWIVDIATIIFLIELISGIILWWPVKWNKHTRDASFKIKWNARFKRVNYDLHNVLGFYSSILALILTITGLLIAFHPLAESTVKLLGGDPDHEKWEQELPKADFTKNAVAMNAALEKEFNRYPDQKGGRIWLYNADSSGYFLINTATKLGLKSAENSRLSFIDKYTGEDINIPAKGLKGEYIENYIWQLHMGTWMGQAGKLFTFICGLICTSLPVTGFLIWWHRGRKKKKPAKKIISRNLEAGVPA
ncbi:PepSY domain-containing protein [Terrimonas sp.]|uniref:PepSY-associated TM helix domain-containing protein n=1 Tax=Terrimonas sp. TaxID=1914338 RepID=UPI000D51933B|nr:PepSY-associated TM helix domain-containing protein [Terrimonas sp.]PVD52271.1 PepSY domain-containing protein [Terrimonas sp.]